MSLSLSYLKIGVLNSRHTVRTYYVHLILYCANKNIIASEGQESKNLLLLMETEVRCHVSPAYCPKKLMAYATITYYNKEGQCLCKGATTIIGTVIIIIIDTISAELGITLEHDNRGIEKIRDLVDREKMWTAWLIFPYDVMAPRRKSSQIHHYGFNVEFW